MRWQGHSERCIPYETSAQNVPRRENILFPAGSITEIRSLKFVNKQAIKNTKCSRGLIAFRCQFFISNHAPEPWTVPWISHMVRLVREASNATTYVATTLIGQTDLTGVPSAEDLDTDLSPVSAVSSPRQSPNPELQRKRLFLCFQNWSVGRFIEDTSVHFSMWSVLLNIFKTVTYLIYVDDVLSRQQQPVSEAEPEASTSTSTRAPRSRSTSRLITDAVLNNQARIGQALAQIASTRTTIS